LIVVLDGGRLDNDGSPIEAISGECCEAFFDIGRYRDKCRQHTGIGGAVRAAADYDCGKMVQHILTF
jgi:hypothetical protein